MEEEARFGWERTAAANATPPHWLAADPVSGTPEQIAKAKTGTALDEYQLAWLLYHKNHNVKESLPWLMKAASHGQPSAWADVAWGYTEGVWGLPRNEKMAGEYYLKLKDLSYVGAQVKLGTMYEYGWGGVQKDFTLACRSYSFSHITQGISRTCKS